MIDRDALVEAVSREVFARTNRGKPNDGWSGPDDWRIIEKITGFYIDAIEGRVREDEQERHGNNCGGMWDEWLADLYAQVEALRDEAMQHRRDTGDPTFATSVVCYQTVLELFKRDE